MSLTILTVALALHFLASLPVHAAGPVVRIDALQAQALAASAGAWGVAPTGWSGGGDCSQVQGVTCDSNGTVVAINLANCSLSGYIPTTFSALTSLSLLTTTTSQPSHTCLTFAFSHVSLEAHFCLCHCLLLSLTYKACSRLFSSPYATHPPPAPPFYSSPPLLRLRPPHPSPFLSLLPPTPPSSHFPLFSPILLGSPLGRPPFFPHLPRRDLSHNSLWGTMPSFLSLLENLRRL
ncbi:unnamed protein product [Closterium sp. Naga37s-1]|nr:unnamed protein product [Closterium sp. Naga37s-1]